MYLYVHKFVLRGPLSCVDYIHGLISLLETYTYTVKMLEKVQGCDSFVKYDISILRQRTQVILILYEAILSSFVTKEYRQLGYVGFAHPQSSRAFEQKILGRPRRQVATAANVAKAPNKLADQEKRPLWEAVCDAFSCNCPWWRRKK